MKTAATARTSVAKALVALACAAALVLCTGVVANVQPNPIGKAYATSYNQGQTVNVTKKKAYTFNAKNAKYSYIVLSVGKNQYVEKCHYSNSRVASFSWGMDDYENQAIEVAPKKAGTVKLTLTSNKGKKYTIKIKITKSYINKRAAR